MSYNGIGLQTTRGSGTNGYVQTNKFHRSASRLQRTEWRDLKDIHGGGPKSNKPNEEILAHQRKREIEVKLATLEDDLEEKGAGAEEIAERLKEARAKFERDAQRKSGPDRESTPPHQRRFEESHFAPTLKPMRPDRRSLPR